MTTKTIPSLFKTHKNQILGGDEEGGDGFIPVIIVRRVGGGDVEGEPGVGLPSGFPFGGSAGEK